MKQYFGKDKFVSAYGKVSATISRNKYLAFKEACQIKGFSVSKVLELFIDNYLGGQNANRENLSLNAKHQKAIEEYFIDPKAYFEFSSEEKYKIFKPTSG